MLREASRVVWFSSVMKLLLVVGCVLCLAWRILIQLRDKDWKRLAVDVFCWITVYVLAFMIAELKCGAERSFLSYQTGHALSLIAEHLSSEAGMREVKRKIESQLERDVRVNYSDLGNLVRSLSLTNEVSK